MWRIVHFGLLLMVMYWHINYNTNWVMQLGNPCLSCYDFSYQMTIRQNCTVVTSQMLQSQASVISCLVMSLAPDWLFGCGSDDRTAKTCWQLPWRYPSLMELSTTSRDLVWNLDVIPCKMLDSHSSHGTVIHLGASCIDCRNLSDCWTDSVYTTCVHYCILSLLLND